MNSPVTIKKKSQIHKSYPQRIHESHSRGRYQISSNFIEFSMHHHPKIHKKKAFHTSQNSQKNIGVGVGNRGWRPATTPSMRRPCGGGSGLPRLGGGGCGKEEDGRATPTTTRRPRGGGSGLPWPGGGGRGREEDVWTTPTMRMPRGGGSVVPPPGGGGSALPRPADVGSAPPMQPRAATAPFLVSLPQPPSLSS